MAPKQKAAYKAMQDTMIAEIAEMEDHIVATTAIAQLTRLVQFASAYAVLEDGAVRLAAPSCKVDALESIMADELPEGEPVVVFAMSKQLIDLAHNRLMENGYACARITGGQSTNVRAQAIEDFQAGRVQVILCTVGAGGVGVTLTRAKTAIFLQRSWSMVDNIQAEARVHRIGSEIHDSVTIIDLVSTGTVDQRMQDVIATKKGRLEEIVRDKDMLLKFLQGKEV
jgi:SNF2 family DNA or RNA helicase